MGKREGRPDGDEDDDDDEGTIGDETPKPPEDMETCMSSKKVSRVMTHGLMIMILHT